MEITVQVSPEVMRTLHQRGPSNAESKQLLGVVESLGLKLEPMHRGTDDPILQGYFIVDVPDRATAQRVLDRLQQLEAVKAAYVKPLEEPP